MSTSPPLSGAERADGASLRIGALVPLTRPGWVEAGRHLLAGLELAVGDVNDAGGIGGRPLELVVRDTAADPRRAAAAVDELARLGVAALAGEYHSVVARAAAARADAAGLPFLCSSAVLDALTDQPTEWVARLAPAQSHGWQIYADFLLGAGHSRIAVAVEPSVYWASGTRILREHLVPRGGSVIELDMRALTPAAVCDELVDAGATALLLLVGHPEPAVSIVRSVRRDRRLAGILVGAPAGQLFVAPVSRVPWYGRMMPSHAAYQVAYLVEPGVGTDVSTAEQRRARPQFTPRLRPRRRGRRTSSPPHRRCRTSSPSPPSSTEVGTTPISARHGDGSGPAGTC
ncbi:ABC transporter substrate-binding protein [Streptomyces bobili]|uniref:ABC transporter substrate-binding protein n=1 Tax=Streptomyces bobili TaxID=67280 RepID=UPI0033A7BD39